MSSQETTGRRRPSFWLWAALALVMVLIVVLAVVPKPPEQTKDETEKPVAVRALTIEPRKIEDALLLPGRILALQEAQLGAQRPGQVVEIVADKGQTVEAGQVLLRIDSRLWEAARKRAAIEVRDAEKDLKRWKELEKSGAVSASDYEGIQRRQESAEIALEEAEVMASQCEVRAPFAGVIVERGVEVGDYANEGQAVLSVIRLDRVKVAFDVPEQDVSSLKPGQAKKFTLTALPGREFTGEVTFVSSQAGRDSNSFAAELEAENADGTLKAGMIAQVALVRQEREGAMLVPLAAIVPRKGEHYVFVVENGRAVRKRVLLGALIGHEAVLESGVAAGERIVVEGHRGLQDGQPVSESGAEAAVPLEAAPAAEAPAVPAE
jgi:membrane fusion protein (multidrug efflux system)